MDPAGCDLLRLHRGERWQLRSVHLRELPEHGCRAQKQDTEGDHIEGWEINLIDGPNQLHRPALGQVTFTITAPGAYRITEEARAGWTHMGPTSFDFTAVSGGSYGTLHLRELPVD